MTALIVAWLVIGAMIATGVILAIVAFMTGRRIERGAENDRRRYELTPITQSDMYAELRIQLAGMRQQLAMVREELRTVQPTTFAYSFGGNHAAPNRAQKSVSYRARHLQQA